jgi:3alpha(or 20beta)-hydroxysteroid dehydrogenase
MGRLQGKAALVTGAAKGMGEAIARLFAEEGARVLVADIDSERGAAVADSIGEAAVFQTLNVSQSGQWREAIESASSRFGGLNILVNCAGIAALGSLTDGTEDDFDRVIGINLRGVFLGMRHAAPLLAQSGGGSIVNFSSSFGLKGMPGAVHYPTSKFGVRGLTRAAAYDLAPQGIRVNAVLPGPINTDQLNGAAKMIAAHDPEWLDKVRQGTLLKRLGEPIEIARAVLFLASDDASYVTGADFVIDGGMMA